MKKLFLFFILLFVATNLTFAETADDEKLILQQRLLFSQNQGPLSFPRVVDFWYKDADGDGYGDPTQGIATSFFYANYGYVADNTDCDDSESSIYPGATEIGGDGIDQDCDGEDDVLDAPSLTVTISDVNVSLSWTDIQLATGYTLFYAPYPDASYIEQIDMGTAIGISLDLWGGAAFYVAVKAYNSSGSSEYSNIEYFDLPLSDSTFSVNLNADPTSGSLATFFPGVDPVMNVTFTPEIVVPGTEPYEYFIDYGDDSAEETIPIPDVGAAPEITHDYTTSGTYEAKLRVVDADGSTANAEVTITVLE
jgi:Putative metal-binding motif/PKD domain